MLIKPLHELTEDELAAFFLAHPDHLKQLCKGMASLAKGVHLAVEAFAELSKGAQILEQSANQSIMFPEGK